jgi:hypothetical protein
MVRHVEIRIELETAILLDDIDRTATLLDKVAAFLDAAGEVASNCARSIRSTLADAPALLTGASDDAQRARTRALNLRECVYKALACLQKLDATAKGTERYYDTRRMIREYIAYEIEQEARLIQPAFFGKGPRR